MAFSSGRAPSCLSRGTDALEYAIQATASVWMPFEQVLNIVSGDVDFDYFGMAPWDAGGMHDDRCQLREALQTIMLQWLMRLLCRPVIMIDRTMTMNTENGLDTIMMITTDSPRLAVTPGEWYASGMLTLLSRDLRRMNGAMYNSRTEWGFPQVDSAVADSGTVELDDLIFRRLSLPPEEVSAGRDGNYGSLKIDSAAVDYGTGAVGLDDLIFRRTNLPPDEFSTGWNGDYIWRDLWTGPSACNRPVTGSPTFGSSHSLEQCCLWLAALPLRWIGSAEVPLCHHLLQLVSRTSHDVEASFHSPLCRHSLGNVFAGWNKYDLVIFLDSPLCRDPVWPDGGSVFAELDMSLYDPCLWVCHQLLVFNPAVRHTASGAGEICSFSPSSRLILTLCYCFYEFLREQKLRTNRLPDTDKANSFHGQTSWVRFNNCEPNFQDAMELWALRPTQILGKVISVCRIHVFFHQYVSDLRDERSENVVLLMSALKDSQPEGENYVLQSAIQKEKAENVLRTFAT